MILKSDLDVQQFVLITFKGEGNLSKLRRVSFFSLSVSSKIKPGKPYKKGKLSTVDLLVITSLNHLLFILKVLFILAIK